MKKTTFGMGTLFALFTVFVISGCGEDVCVSGIGNCKAPANVENQSGETGTVSGSLTIFSNAPKVGPGNKVTIYSKGGTGALKFEIKEGGGRLLEISTRTANTGTSSVSYEAPTNSSEPWAILQVSDAENHIVQMAIVIKASRLNE